MTSNKIIYILPGHPSPIGGFKLIYLHASILSKKGYDVEVIHVNPWLDINKYHIVKIIKAYIIFFWMKNFSLWRSYPKESFNIKTKTINTLNINFEKHIKYVILSWQLVNYYSKLNDLNRLDILHYAMDIPGFMGNHDEVRDSLSHKIKYIAISKYMLNIVKDVNINADVRYLPCFTNRKNYNCNKNYDICGNLTLGKYKNTTYSINLYNELSVKYKIILFGRIKRPNELSENIDYHQSPNDDEVNKIYAISRSFICVSEVEGFGLPGLEAMGNDALVFSTNNGGCEDYCIFDINSIELTGNDLLVDVNRVNSVLNNKKLIFKIVENARVFLVNYNNNINIEKSYE